ncbi:MAG: polysaccharide biosynthesis protein [Bacteroidales bacterium]|nr:polysaccharide biosynthesis protein [Bacteroidales bacterium]
MKKRLARYITEYLDSKAIFALDLVLSVAASAVVLLTLNFFATDVYYHGSFALRWMAASLIASVAAMLLFRSYELIVRHTTLRDLARYLLTIACKVVLMGLMLAVTGVFNMTVLLALFFDFLLSIFLLLSIRLAMTIVYDIYKSKVRDMQDRQRVIVVGTSDKSVAAITRLQNSPHYKVVGFLSTNPSEKGFKIGQLDVYSYRNDADLKSLVNKLSLRALLFASEDDAQREGHGLVEFCAKQHLMALIAPTIDEVVGGKFMKHKVRQVKIEDLLGRPEIKISMEEIVTNFQGKTILVTGAAGSIGSELCRQLARLGIKKLILFDNAETPMHNLRLEMEGRFPDLNFVPVIGDVRQPDRIDYAFRTWHPQVVFHAAAYKHVPLMEENPCEAVFVNVYGTRNVAQKCIEYDVERMVMISTDKAVNPTNIMGCSKRLAEIYVQSLGLAIAQGKEKGRTRFVTTRFGNVLGSNGSVIPLFRKQIETGGPVTVTHPDITRFFMTIPEACRLVMEAATLSRGNEIFVFDMGESIKIDTLARRMIELAGLRVGEDIEIQYTGLRPGEKLYEEVLSNEENTVPTTHDRIRIAKVREYDFTEAEQTVLRLTELSRHVDIPEMVRMMKRTVPEFISKNSRFEAYDKESDK